MVAAMCSNVGGAGTYGALGSRSQAMRRMLCVRDVMEMWSWWGPLEAGAYCTPASRVRVLLAWRAPQTYG
jgi:hypothetical protein